MQSMNQVILLGRMGNGTRKSTLPNGTPYIKFSVCTNTKNFGENEDQGQWHDCECWGDLATIIDRLNIGKGQEVYLIGSMRTTRPQGCKEKHSSVVVKDIKVFPYTPKHVDYNAK